MCTSSNTRLPLKSKLISTCQRESARRTHDGSQLGDLLIDLCGRRQRLGDATTALRVMYAGTLLLFLEWDSMVLGGSFGR